MKKCQTQNSKYNRTFVVVYQESHDQVTCLKLKSRDQLAMMEKYFVPNTAKNIGKQNIYSITKMHTDLSMLISLNKTVLAHKNSEVQLRQF